MLNRISQLNCKRSQYSCLSLAIYFVYCKNSEIPLLPAKDTSALLLNKLYGLDKNKLKQNLVRLCRFNKLSSKERAEMRKEIDNF